MNDKVKHYIASGVISLISLILFALIPYEFMFGWDKAISLFLGIFAGAIKEFIWDKLLGKGTFEWRDLESSVYGSFTITFVWLIGETIIYVIKYGF